MQVFMYLGQQLQRLGYFRPVYKASNPIWIRLSFSGTPVQL